MPKRCLPLIALFFALGSGRSMNCGKEEEKVIRPGDDVTLQCGCRRKNGWDIFWVRSCSPLAHPMVISSYESLITPIPRYSAEWNAVNDSNDLIIKNITESDLGLYYCALVKLNMGNSNDGKLTANEVYHICNTSTKLSYEVPRADPPCVPVTMDCGQCWLIMKIACLVCAVLLVLLFSTCAFFMCCKTGVTKSDSDGRGPATMQQNSGEQTEDTQVYYASLNIPKGPSRRAKRKASLNPDFSVYSELNKEQG